jgi:hypothetical protein
MCPKTLRNSLVPCNVSHICRVENCKKWKEFEEEISGLTRDDKTNDAKWQGLSDKEVTISTDHLIPCTQLWASSSILMYPFLIRLPSSSWVTYPWFVRHNGILFLNHWLILYPDKSISFVQNFTQMWKKNWGCDPDKQFIIKKIEKTFFRKARFLNYSLTSPKSKIFKYIYIYIYSPTCPVNKSG